MEFMLSGLRCTPQSQLQLQSGNQTLYVQTSQGAASVICRATDVNGDCARGGEPAGRPVRTHEGWMKESSEKWWRSMICKPELTERTTLHGSVLLYSVRAQTYMTTQSSRPPGCFDYFCRSFYSATTRDIFRVCWSEDWASKLSSSAADD